MWDILTLVLLAITAQGPSAQERSPSASGGSS